MAGTSNKNQAVTDQPVTTEEWNALVDENDKLRTENADLRRQLTQARSGKPDNRHEFHVPDWIPEGTREELERNGYAVNPFNGDKLGTWPDEK